MRCSMFSACEIRSCEISAAAVFALSIAPASRSFSRAVGEDVPPGLLLSGSGGGCTSLCSSPKSPLASEAAFAPDRQSKLLLGLTIYSPSRGANKINALARIENDRKPQNPLGATLGLHNRRVVGYRCSLATQ